MSVAHTRPRKRRSYKALQFCIAGITAMAVANAIIELAAPLAKQRIRRSRIQYVATPEGDLCTQVIGDTPSVLLLHDLQPGCSMGDFSTLVDLLDDDAFVAVDLLGYGRSDRPATTYSIEMHTDHVREVLSQFPTVTKIIAHGYATSIAIRLVQTGFDSDSLVLINPDYAQVENKLARVLSRVPIIGPFVYHATQIAKDPSQYRRMQDDDRLGNKHRSGSANVAHGPTLHDLCESLVLPADSDVHVFHIDSNNAEQNWNKVRGIVFEE